jgi:hypothetical protein
MTLTASAVGDPSDDFRQLPRNRPHSSLIAPFTCHNQSLPAECNAAQIRRSNVDVHLPTSDYQFGYL